MEVGVLDAGNPPQPSALISFCKDELHLPAETLGDSSLGYLAKRKDLMLLTLKVPRLSNQPVHIAAALTDDNLHIHLEDSVDSAMPLT